MLPHWCTAWQGGEEQDETEGAPKIISSTQKYRHRPPPRLTPAFPASIRCPSAVVRHSVIPSLSPSPFPSPSPSPSPSLSSVVHNCSYSCRTYRIVMLPVQHQPSANNPARHGSAPGTVAALRPAGRAGSALVGSAVRSERCAPAVGRVGLRRSSQVVRSYHASRHGTSAGYGAIRRSAVPVGSVRPLVP